MAVMTTPPAGHQQHLYLVLESLEDEYSIHKIDVRDFDPDDDDDTDDLDSRARPLHHPPLLRVEAESNSATSFVAHGGKIFAMAPSPGRSGLAIDTRTMRITGAPLPQANTEPYNCSGLIAVGDRIYSMDAKEGDDGEGSCNFEVLSFGSASRCSSSSSSNGRCWSWSSVPSQPPFDPVCTTCYAVHPDGRTIFFSVPHGEDAAGATFSFDTETAKWTFRGHWMLPFHGPAHYDEELDAWVGLHGGGGKGGRVSCCDVVPPATGDEGADEHEQPPAWKLARDRLYSRAKGRRRHTGGALVYMGSSTFCVVERVTEKELTREQWKRIDEEPPRLLLYVRTFGLKYGKTGRLRLATCGRRARCYALPEGTRCDEMFMTLRALWV